MQALGIPYIDIFLLIFTRMTGLFVAAPIFGRRNMPTYLKIGFSLLLALILINTINIKDYRVEYNNFLIFCAIIAKEFIVGLTLGYVSYVIFTAIHFAGQVIDMQVGFGLVNILDPVSNLQVPVTANFYYLVAMLVFLINYGHHVLITALFESYRLVPLGKAVFNANLLDKAMEIFYGVFVIAFKISAPILATILITDVALGILSRTVPQINVFVVGIPIKITVGLLILFFTMPLFVSIVEFLIKEMDKDLISVLKNMSIVAN